MVGILATLALPSISYQMKSNRIFRASQEVAALYRQARIRAMGRGSAVMFRFSRDAGSPGSVVIFEAMTPLEASAEEGVEGPCQTPRASCQQTNWTDDKEYRQIGQFLPGSGVYDKIAMTMERGEGEAPTPLNNAEFCFTPLGRLFFRTDTGVPFTPLPDANGALSIRVARTDGISFPRRVLLPTNGAASVVAVTP